MAYKAFEDAMQTFKEGMRLNPPKHSKVRTYFGYCCMYMGMILHVMGNMKKAHELYALGSTNLFYLPGDDVRLINTTDCLLKVERNRPITPRHLSER